MLLSIAKGDSTNKILIEKLKQINTEEAAILLKINRSEYRRFRPQHEKDFYHLQQLEKAGLVTRSYAGIIRTGGILFSMILIIWSVSSYFDTAISRNSLSAAPFDGKLSIYLPGFIGLLVLYVVMLINMRIRGLSLLNRLRWPGVWYLSWIGEQLTNYAKTTKKGNEEV